MMSGNGFEEELRETLLLRDHRPIRSVHEPLVAVGKMIFEGSHAFDDLLARAGLEDFAERADVGIGVCIG